MLYIYELNHKKKERHEAAIRYGIEQKESKDTINEHEKKDDKIAIETEFNNITNE